MNLDIKRFFVVLLIGIIIFPVSVFGQDIDKAVIEYNGQKGYFFSEEVGDRILRDLVEYKRLKYEKVPALELKIKMLEYDVSLHKKSLEYSEAMKNNLEESFKVSEDLRISETSYLRSQLDGKYSWYKHPVTTFILGIVSGGLLAVGLSFGLNE